MLRTGANAGAANNLGDEGEAITLGVNQDFYQKYTKSFKNEGEDKVERLYQDPERINPNYVPKDEVRLISGVLHKETPSQTTQQRDQSIPHSFNKTAPRENMGILEFV